MHNDDLLGTAEAADLIGIGHSTLRRWRTQGRGPTYLALGNGFTRYRRADIDTWLNARQVQGDIPIAGEVTSGQHWDGTWPVWQFGDDTTPPPGQPVVYTLYDEHDKVAYVGSTQDFCLRMRQHERAGKVMHRWEAESYVTRKKAFQAECVLARRLQPYLVGTDEPAEPGNDAAVTGYYRQRNGKWEFVRSHSRGPRSKTPGGYKKLPRQQ